MLFPKIAKASKNRDLIKKIKDISGKETNNGVRNVYLKALEQIEKNNKWLNPDIYMDIQIERL